MIINKRVEKIANEIKDSEAINLNSLSWSKSSPLCHIKCDKDELIELHQQLDFLSQFDLQEYVNQSQIMHLQSEDFERNSRAGFRDLF